MEQATIAGVQDSRRAVKSCSDHPREGKCAGRAQQEAKGCMLPGAGGQKGNSGLKITSQEWLAFLDDFQQTLDKFKVPAREQAELKAIIDSTRADKVTG